MRPGFLAALVFASIGGHAFAQTGGTIETKSYPTSQDGTRVGCSIGFMAAVEDYAYRRGKPVVINGSMGFMFWPGKSPAVTLKLALTDANSDGSYTGKDTPPPSSISLVGADGESNASSQIMSEIGENNNARIALYSLEGFPEIFDQIATKKELVVLFNREKGGVDVRTVVDLTVERLSADGAPVLSEQTVYGFVDCAEKLLAQIEASGTFQN